MSSSETSEKSDVSETIETIRKKKDYDQNLRKKIILFIGLTGTGKSTLAHFLAGNPKLKSIKDHADYYITDGNEKVSEETTTSKTLFPELILDPESGNVMADCPGFSDTRSVSHDIAATIFTRELLKKAEKVKIVIAASHHSVRKGVDRLAFPNLLNHAAEFLTSINKYRNSTALMITKVENTSEDDLIIIEGIGKFLIEMKNVLKQQPQNDFTDKKIQLLNIFLEKKGGLYANIGIFLRPDMEGPLDELDNLMDGKIRNREILFNQLQYTESNSDDFGLSVSDKSKMTVIRMIHATSQNISKLLDDECNMFQTIYDANIGNVNTPDELQTTITDMSEMINQIEIGNQPDFQITETIQWFNTSYTQENDSFETNLLEQQRYLDFLKPLQPIRKGKKQSNDFTKYYRTLAKFKQVLALKKTSAADKMVKMIDRKIRNLVDGASQNLTATYDSKIVATNALNELQFILEGSSNFINQMKQTDEMKFRILDPINWFQKSFIELPGDFEKDLLEQKSCLDFVKKIYIADSARNNLEDFTSYYSTMAKFESAFVQINSKVSEKMVTLTDENIEKLFNGTANGFIQRYDSEVTVANIDQLQQMLLQITIFIENLKKTHKKTFRIADAIDWFGPSNIEIPKDFEKGLTEQEMYLKSIENNTINTAKRTISHYPEVAKIESAFVQINSKVTDKMVMLTNENIEKLFNSTANFLTQRYNSEVTVANTVDQLHQMLLHITIFIDNMNKTHKKTFRIADAIDWFERSNIEVPNDFEKGLTEQEVYLKSIEEHTINTDAKKTISHYPEVAKIESAFIEIKTIITDKMTEIINQNIKDTFDTTSKMIIMKFNEEIEKSTNYPALEKQLKDAFELVSKFNEQLSYMFERSTTVAPLMTELLKKIFTTVPQDQEEKLLTHSNDINFLIAATNTNRIKFPENLKNAQQHLEDTSKWYTFINHCFEKLSKYYIQKNLTTSDVDKNKNFAEFKLFLDKYNISYDKNLTLDASKEKSFDNLIKKTLTKSKVHCCVETNKLVIKGNFVKLSDIQECKKQQCNDESSLYIFAYHTLFIDIDLMKEGKERSVYIVSPIWDVQQEVTFNLNGRNGLQPLPSTAAVEKNGISGNPGGPGGNFLGVGIEFINGYQLTITANGGAGGNGQNGGNGRNGMNGITPDKPGDSMWHTKGSTDTCRSQASKTRIDRMTQDGDDFILYGTKGTIGQNAGNGGQAGIGGPNGEIQVISTNGLQNNIIISKIAGINGKSGSVGIGGTGGTHGDKLSCVCYIVTKFWEHQYSVRFRDFWYTPDGKSENGRDGIVDNSGTALQRNAIPKSESMQSLSNVYQSGHDMNNEFFNPIDFKNFPNTNNRNKRSINHQIVDLSKNSAFHTPSVLLKGFFKCINKHTNYIVSQLAPNRVGTNNINLDHKQLGQGTSSNRSFGSTITPSVDAFNSLILLLDVIARKLTKAKPSSKILHHQTDIHWLEAQGAALNIVEKCEARWINLHRIDMIDENDFDFLALQRSVLKKVLQQDGREDLGQVEKNAIELVDAYYLKSQQ
jgi:hypothetical protein